MPLSGIDTFATPCIVCEFPYAYITEELFTPHTRAIISVHSMLENICIAFLQ